MKIKNYFVMIMISVLFSACDTQSTPTLKSSITVPSVNWTATLIIETMIPPSATKEVGCVLPPVKIAEQNIRHFYWSDNSEQILYKEKDGQVWYSYDIVSGQTIPVTFQATATPFVDSSAFGISNYEEAFVSPDQEIVVFTRGTPEKYDVYYKSVDEQQEHHLGVIQGYIKEIDWFNREKKAAIAMEWQSPAGIPEAHLYLIDFSENKLLIEIPRMNEYHNLEYLGMTPDETRLLFVSYGNEQRDVTVKLWRISTNEITSTPLLNPLELQWVSESELLSISPNPSLPSFVNVQVFNIDDSTLINLADAKFSIEPFIVGAMQIAPNKSYIAYIERETLALYWTVCKY